jgi:D-3-phosphoglycerate dehydrogenase
MTIARQQKGGKALSVITVDSPVEGKILDKLKGEISADAMRSISISDEY